jgi:hypothetical protein
VDSCARNTKCFRKSSNGELHSKKYYTVDRKENLSNYIYKPSLVSQNDLREISKRPSIPALTAKHC